MLRDHRALRRHFRIQRGVVGPLRRQVIFVENRSNRTFGNTRFAVDAFLRMDKQDSFTFVEAFNRANNNAVRVFAVEARLSNNMSHLTPFQASRSGDLFIKTEMIYDTLETELNENKIHDQNPRPIRFKHKAVMFRTTRNIFF